MVVTNVGLYMRAVQSTDISSEALIKKEFKDLSAKNVGVFIQTPPFKAVIAKKREMLILEF